LADLGWTPADTTATLALVDDWAQHHPERFSDPVWLGKCFSALHWKPDAGRSQIRLTRYLIYEVEGRLSPDADHPYALYALPADEAGLTEAQAEEKRATLLRFRYSRQDVLAGVYRTGGASENEAPALVWLSLRDHEQALMQGSVSVRLPGEPTRRLYNVHRANGIPYDRSIKETTQQPRYWYFRGLDRVRGWGVEPVPGIALEPLAAVAGDHYNLGLGRLIALKSADGLRLVVLADTGGAFQPNLHQLDLYSGTYPSFSAFSDATSGIGDYADAWVLKAICKVGE
jgi:membrane-bound lytic murein transglycosylase